MLARKVIAALTLAIGAAALALVAAFALGGANSGIQRAAGAPVTCPTPKVPISSGACATPTPTPLVATMLLDAVQVKKQANACPHPSTPAANPTPTPTVLKCTLNVGDELDILAKATNIPAGHYGDWTLTLTSIATGPTFKSATVTSGACNGGVPQATVVDPHSITASCTSSNGTSNASPLLTARANCTATGTLTLQVTFAGTAAPAATMIINCGETARIGAGLRAGTTCNDPRIPNANVLVKDKVTVCLNVDQLKLKDFDGDGKAGYVGWQARLNYDAGLQVQGSPSFQLPAGGLTATASGAGTILLGSASSPGQQETNQSGNLVGVTFQCTSPGIHTITLKNTLDTFLVSEKKGQPTLTVEPANVSVDCRVGTMSLTVKGGAKTSQGNTYWVYQGNKFTVSVHLDQVRNLSYDAVTARILFGSNVSGQSTTYDEPPCPAPGSATLISGGIDVYCATGNSTFQDGNIFDVVFQCTANNPTGINSVVMSLTDDGTGTRTGLLDKTNTWQPVYFPNDSVKIRCVGSGSDKDGDGCRAAQELAFVPPLNPNVRDFWDTDGDHRVSIKDVVRYVNNFGQPPAGSLSDTNNDGMITIADINNALAQFGYSCA